MREEAGMETLELIGMCVTYLRSRGVAVPPAGGEEIIEMARRELGRSQMEEDEKELRERVENSPLREFVDPEPVGDPEPAGEPMGAGDFYNLVEKVAKAAPREVLEEVFIEHFGPESNPSPQELRERVGDFVVRYHELVGEALRRERIRARLRAAHERAKAAG